MARPGTLLALASMHNAIQWHAASSAHWSMEVPAVPAAPHQGEDFPCGFRAPSNCNASQAWRGQIRLRSLARWLV